jgi:hypothetical protein
MPANRPDENNTLDYGLLEDLPPVFVAEVARGSWPHRVLDAFVLVVGRLLPAATWASLPGRRAKYLLDGQIPELKVECDDTGGVSINLRPPDEDDEEG